MRRYILFIVTVLLLTALTGCGLHAAEERLDAVEDAAEARVEVIEDAVEQKIMPEIPVPAADAPQVSTATPAATPPPPIKPVEKSSKLTKAEAEKIALDHAGLSAAEVTRLHTEYDVDDGVPEYDVDFHADGFEYDYEIHAETGAVLRAEKEVDD